MPHSMPHLARSILVVVAVLLPGGCQPSDTPEAAAVRTCFNDYLTAIGNKDGKAAVAIVDSRTVTYYDTILDHALKSKSDVVRGLPILDKTMVLMLRSRVPADELRKMDARAVFIHTVDEGWVATDRTIFDIGQIDVNGDRAFGQHLMRGQETPYKCRFVKEDGKWKIDITSLYSSGEAEFEKAIKESQMSEDDFLTRVLSMTAKKPVDASIWEPVAAGDDKQAGDSNPDSE